MKEPVSTDGAVAPTASRKPKFDPMTIRPENVSIECWMDWCQYRKEIRKPLTARMCQQQAKALAGHPSPDAVLNQSIANGWTGIFPDKVSTPAQSRHHGFDRRDYTEGLNLREDGTHGF